MWWQENTLGGLGTHALSAFLCFWWISSFRRFGFPPEAVPCCRHPSLVRVLSQQLHRPLCWCCFGWPLFPVFRFGPLRLTSQSSPPASRSGLLELFLLYYLFLRVIVSLLRRVRPLSWGLRLVLHLVAPPRPCFLLFWKPGSLSGHRIFSDHLVPLLPPLGFFTLCFMDSLLEGSWSFVTKVKTLERASSSWIKNLWSHVIL